MTRIKPIFEEKVTESRSKYGSFLEQIDSRVRDALENGLGEANRWKGFKLRTIDGSCSKLADTKENQ